MSMAYRHNAPTSQILQCIKQIPQHAPFCNRNVHMCAHFCYKIVHRCICTGALCDFYCETCLAALLFRSNLCLNNYASASARIQFFQRNENELTEQQDMFSFYHASAFYTSNNIVNKLLINNKYKAHVYMHMTY